MRIKRKEINARRAMKGKIEVKRCQHSDPCDRLFKLLGAQELKASALKVLVLPCRKLNS